jgi:hypothetical protein
LKTGRELHPTRSSNDRHLTLLKGLAERFKSIAPKLWELVKEENTSVGERDLTRNWH